MHSADLLPVGSLIELRFTVLVDDLTLIEAVAKVVRHSRRPQGMGVEFVSMSAQMTRDIEALLAQREPVDSGAPLRLPEPRQAQPIVVEDDPTRRIELSHPAPVGAKFGAASFEPVDDDDEGATASFPRVPGTLDHAEATTVFRPPPMPGSQRAGADEDERTRQFPALKHEPK